MISQPFTALGWEIPSDTVYADQIRDQIQIRYSQIGDWDLPMLFNFLSLLIELNVPQSILEKYYRLYFNQNGSCQYLKSLWPGFSRIGKVKRYNQVFLGQLSACDLFEIRKGEETNFDNTINPKLSKKLVEMRDKDQFFRKDDYSNHIANQVSLDIENQKNLDSLFAIYKTYIGEKLVGKEYSYVMWEIIVHSDHEFKSRYWDTLKKAWFDKEISQIQYLIFLDKYFFQLKGYQLFGTQYGSDIPVLDSLQRRSILDSLDLKILDY